MATAEELEKEFVVPERAAKILKITRGTLANQRTARKGPPYHIVNGRILYSVTALREYIESRTVHPEG